MMEDYREINHKQQLPNRNTEQRVQTTETQERLRHIKKETQYTTTHVQRNGKEKGNEKETQEQKQPIKQQHAKRTKCGGQNTKNTKKHKKKQHPKNKQTPC